MTTNPAILKLSGVTKSYRASSEGAIVEVLKGVDLEIAAGGSLAIVGPSGSGKSTLLNVIGALDRPDSGRVQLDDADLWDLSDDQLADVRRQKVGFIFQSHHLLPQLTVLENTLAPTLANPDRESRAAAPDRARSLLKRVGLCERVDHRPGQLSGGERQRVAVVRALINKPRLLLADEPTGALDRASAENLTRLLKELNREENLALIVVTHALDLAAQMERVWELRDGILVERKTQPSTAGA